MAERPSGNREVTLRLDLLGEFAARDGENREVAISSRKAQALLAILALPPGKPQSREKLTGLLWSDRGESQARSSLRQALTELRRALGETGRPSLVAGREAVSLDAETVEVDVTEFERFIGDGTPAALERAAELYRGGLLHGIGVHDPAFEDWLRDERRRLQERACEALSKLLDHQAAGDAERAVATARRLLALDPLREATHRALMRLHAGRGERTLALKQYQDCRDALQAELGVEPSAETERLHEEIRHTQPPVQGHLPNSSNEAAPLAAVAPSDNPAIAVVPFVNMSGDPEQEYFADGMTEDIITELSRFHEFDVIARNSSFQFKGRAAEIQDVGRQLGARYIVEGSVRKSGSRVRVTAQLIDAETNTHIWADRYDRQLDDIFAIQDDVTAAVVARVADRVKGAGARPSRSRPKQSMTAYDLVLQSRPYRTQYTPASSKEAARLLRRAIALDPNCAQAHAGLAFVLVEIGVTRRDLQV
jgi:TolB-like protein